MQIKADKQSRTYEVTYLIPANLTDSEISRIRDEVSQLITKHKGKVLNTEEMGKKPLAYKIRHQNTYHSEAAYTMLQVEMDPSSAPEIDHALQLHAQVMRHLLVKPE